MRVPHVSRDRGEGQRNVSVRSVVGPWADSIAGPNRVPAALFYSFISFSFLMSVLFSIFCKNASNQFKQIPNFL
jgi:hypothetical protein